MSIDVVLSFSGMRPSFRPIVARTLELVPFVSAGLLESCDLGVGRESGSLLLCAHLSEAPGTADVIARLSSLVEPANGAVQRAAADGGAALVGALKVMERAITPEALAAALERALEVLGGDGSPTCAPCSSNAERAVAAVAPGAPPRVLLIDDLHERLATIADALRGGGFDLAVVGASRGIPVAELISADLVLLTTGDPARAEAPLRTCRAAGRRDLRVLVVSAAPPARDPRLLQAGADVIVSSALPPGELVDTARALLDGAVPPAAAPDATAWRRPAGGGVADRTYR